MNINDLIKEAYEIAVEKGFYGTGYCISCKKYELCSSEYKEEAGSCDLYFYDRNISEMLMLIVSELGEAQEALRKNKRADMRGGINEMLPQVFEDYIKDTFEDELADVFIRLGDLCGYLNIDIEKHIKAKMEYNKGRPRKHGKKF